MDRPGGGVLGTVLCLSRNGLEVQLCPRPDLARPRVYAEVGPVVDLQDLVLNLYKQECLKIIFGFYNLVH